ncbi:hypothetical protein LTR10_020058 [Elasticomyces elasticus]|uniref:FAD-binding FR-type domain-containing protein n=1 Tax=Exophiala sideris TaxID=1016849 RepID=A0ABR0IV98_9EURO|nr:hypothetical protein LTR10_020058 [Elasticomyces elasticus]KAK5021360.1 hypothetical protein LTS07_011103 [Exophiala sideris]KAK5024308.1 hypothetical protein LTR13_010929 [Exophiala sideris]KAK5049251.1 hypothetical protein LTR69_011126 [Exophiala sideris]KAK5176563.1 hypothetical protein LTR44_010951 [Eurotiomycetes sp. CCFEE 6388]
MDELTSFEPLDVLRLALRPSSDLATILEAPPNQGLSRDHIRKIIAAVLWHRKFLLTYYVVIGVVIAISCGRRVYTHTTRSSKKRKENEKSTPDTAETVSSSSSSTLRGTITPPKKDDDVYNMENTPLLDKKGPKQRPGVLNQLRAVLMHQPAPIPALTSTSNVLPNNGTSLLVLLFLGVNLFYLFFRTPLSLEWIFILGDRAGLLFIVNLPVLYILAAKTNQPIKYLTGWSYEGLNLFHQRLGEWMIVFGVIHMLGMLVVWYNILRPLGFDLLRYLFHKTVFLGIAAIISYFTIYVTSVGWFRHLYYETFLGLHIFFQVAALAFLFFHYPTAQPYVVATFFIWAIDRLLWRMTLSSRRYIATLEIAPDEHTILLHCDIDLQRKLFGTRLGLHHGWLPGQHVFLTIPSMGFKYRFQAHPFTIASPAPPGVITVQKWPLELIIRSIDGFSLDLLEYARHHQHCEIILDGPHGGTEALEAAQHADRVCFIAGGSGIAVTYPLAWNVRVEETLQDGALVSTRTVYHNGTKSRQFIVECGPSPDPTKYAHFWVRQDPRHEKWLSMFPRANTLKQGDRGSQLFCDIVENDGQEKVFSLVSNAFDTRRPGPEGGRPDIKTEIWNWVTTRISDSTTLTSPLSPAQRRPGDKICIIVSGPDGLVRDVRNIAAQLVTAGWNLEIWVEKFGW